jgi:hypothetical protein
MKMKALCVDLFCGLFGWGTAFASEGYRVVGFDIAKMGPVPEGCQLVLQDVLTLHGSQFRDAAVIVASPPCQEFSRWDIPQTRSTEYQGDYKPIVLCGYKPIVPSAESQHFLAEPLRRYLAIALFDLDADSIKP